MEIVDIYGHLVDGSELVIGVGNYNTIHGLACYFSNDDLLQIQPISEVIAPSVLELILKYEKPLNDNSGGLYFSLSVKNTTPTKYVNIAIEMDEQKVARATISNQKTLFTIDYSSVDKVPRSLLLAGSLYSLQTTFGEKNYVVSWKIQGFANGDLIIFLPTTWYEPSQKSEFSYCNEKSGIINLVEKLNQISFRGYSTQQWCEGSPQVINCQNEDICGNCLGQCSNPNHICYPDLSGSKKFICGMSSDETNMLQSSTVSFAEDTPQTTGTTATWIAIISIFVIVGLLAWGLNYKFKS